jgi:hypothetical protein
VKPNSLLLAVGAKVLLRQACNLLAYNVQVHAAGACDADFKTDAAARPRATPGSATFLSDHASATTRAIASNIAES